jgi:hypothetical protein
MACEDRNSRPFSRLDHLQTTGYIFIDWLFDQGGYAGGNGFKTVVHVHLVGCRNDDAIGFFRQQSWCHNSKTTSLLWSLPFPR